MTNEVVKITVTDKVISTQDNAVIRDYADQNYSFKKWVERKYELSSLEAYILTQKLIELYPVLIEESKELFDIVQRNANYVKSRMKNPPDESV